ncbi:MAG: hypothetical protein JSS77_10455 [Acidobacteria bacterium]|nr:hypothetical protein [Acidobacteriota bacterium]
MLESTGFILAAWGAFLSTALALSKLISYLRRNRPLLRFHLVPPVIGKDGKVILSVSNIGSIPVTVINFRFERYSKEIQWWRDLATILPDMVAGIDLSTKAPALPYLLVPGSHIQYIIERPPWIDDWFISDYVYIAMRNSYKKRDLRRRIYPSEGAYLGQV